MDAESKRAFKPSLNRDMVFEYHPKEFPALVSPVAEKFVKGYSGRAEEFHLNEAVAQQSNIANLQKMQDEEKIQNEALARVKDIQEKAYSEAYELGLIEGVQKAFVDSKADLKDRISKIDKMLSDVQVFKAKLLKINEGQLVQLAAAIASKIALKEISVDQQTIIRLLEQVVDEVADSESIKVILSNEDLFFIESLREKLDEKLEVLKNVKLQGSDKLTSGGCVIETEFGAIDATVQERIERAMLAISNRTPKTENE
jgi:flagellar assembly protein FliH